MSSREFLSGSSCNLKDNHVLRLSDINKSNQFSIQNWHASWQSQDTRNRTYTKFGDKSIIILYLPITEKHLNSIQCSSTKVQFLNVLTDKCIQFTRMFSATATSFPRYEKNNKFSAVASVLCDTYCSMSFTELIIILHHVE